MITFGRHGVTWIELSPKIVDWLELEERNKHLCNIDALKYTVIKSTVVQ